MQASSGKWIRVSTPISCSEGRRFVDGYQRPGGSLLAVTPKTDGKDGRFVITHVGSGHRLWPNHWSLVDAKQICGELLALPGWESAPNETLRAAAEAIVRPYASMETTVQ